jgi:hypothetical protein
MGYADKAAKSLLILDPSNKIETPNDGHGIWTISLTVY